MKRELHSEAAYAIARALRDAGHTAYYAGGCVRDFLMGQQPQDFDIATSASPEVVESIFERTIPVGKQFGVILVLIGDKPFEVATFRKEGGYTDGRHPGQVEFTGPQEDASRRDFTVNGLFYDPFNQQVLDFVEGRADIEKKRIRAIGDPDKRFEEDKLRLLRAVRFATSLGFEIEARTWSAVVRRASEITVVSPERIRDELVKILTRGKPSRGYQLLSESGLMKAILPEIESMKGVQQPPDYHPEGDVFIHTQLLLEKLEKPVPELALGALFHDIAKPETYAVREGRITFYEHAPRGAEMTREIMKRLKFSNQQIESVSEAVANHMKFADVQRMRSGKLKQFVSRPNFKLELELHRIDCLSSHGKLDNYHFLQQKLKDFETEELKPKAFLNGHDLLKIGFESGPAIKEVLEEAYLLQLEGQFADRAQALVWAKAQHGRRGERS